nr:YdeI/OmpD-associated family protein [Ruegeria sp. HKCCD4318-2]
MHPAGEAAVSESRKSGLWNFFDDVDALFVPEDLSAILDHEKWKELAPSYRRNVLRWIKLAKKPTTRRKRLTAAADATRLNKKLPQM